MGGPPLVESLEREVLIAGIADGVAVFTSSASFGVAEISGVFILGMSDSFLRAACPSVPLFGGGVGLDI